MTILYRSAFELAARIKAGRLSAARVPESCHRRFVAPSGYGG